MIETQIGGNSSFAIFEAARQDLNGELSFAVKEEVHGLIKLADNDEGEFAEAIKSLNRDKIIEAAVEEFRKSYSALLNGTLDDLIDEF